MHSSPRTLDRYGIPDESLDVIDLRWGPFPANLQGTLVLTARLIILGFSAVKELFSLSFDAKFDGLVKELRELEHPQDIRPPA